MRQIIFSKMIKNGPKNDIVPSYLSFSQNEQKVIKNDQNTGLKMDQNLRKNEHRNRPKMSLTIAIVDLLSAQNEAKNDASQPVLLTPK